MKLILCPLAIGALLLIKVQGQGNGAVRLLVNGQTSAASFSSGIVQVYFNSVWGNICASGSNSKAGDVVCHQLGYSGGRVSSDKFGNDTAPQIIRNFNCDGSELTVLQCPHTMPEDECPDEDDLAVECDDTRIWENPFSGYIRLNGTTDYTGSGLVEVYCNSEWGTICASGFDTNDANTVCRQLGYNAGTVSQMDIDDDLPVWINTPDCGSSTQCLSSCQSCPSTGEQPICDNGYAAVNCRYNSDLDSSGGINGYCAFANSVKNIVGIVVGVLVAFFVCVALAIIIPLVCCCCLGVGVGAACCKRTKHYSHFV